MRKMTTEGVSRADAVKEVRKQLLLAGPLFLVCLLQYSVQVISVTFVGHLDELALSGASMATSFASVTGFNLLMGMASGLDTLCGQSFGAGQYNRVGIHTQRAMVVLTLISASVSILWANTRSILIALHQDHEISAEAGQYACFMIPGLFAFGLLQCLVKFFQTQNNVIPMVISSGITTALHVVLCWTMVFKSGLGSKGAALANSLSYWINMVMLAFYITFSSSCKRTWTGISRAALLSLPSFLKVSVPSAVMLCLKVWTFELVVVLSGLLPNAKLETSVLSICLNTFGLVWTVPFGLGAAVSTRVSNELGAGHPEAASLAAKVVLCMAIVEGILVALLMTLLRNVWGHVYSNEKEVVRYVAVMMPLVAISSFLDAIQSALSGIARGSGWQKIGAYVNLGSFYIVGIPSAVLLGFILHMTAKGLWLGIIAAFGVQSSLLLIISLRTNYKKQADAAAERVTAFIK